MKQCLISFLILLFAYPASAFPGEADTLNRKKGRVYLDVYAGYSIASGKYADNTNQKLSGYAANGFTFQFGGSWLAKSGFGLGVTYSYQNNPLQSGFADDTLVDMNEPLGTKHWNNHYLLAGPVFIREFGKLLLTVKVQVGGVLSYSPLFKLWMPSTDTLNPEAVTLSEGPGFGVAFQGLAGIGYRITDNFSVNLAFSYLGANPSRTKEYSMYQRETNPERYLFVQGERERKKKITSFNISLGVALKL